MAGLPTVQVLLDNGSGTFPYDVTAFAQMVPGYKAKRGRQDELAAVTPGELSLVLDNTDGRFTLGSTIIATPSPIQVDQKIRIKITANATVFTRATAYVQSWPVEWPTGGDEFAIASISATDVQAQGQRQPLLSIIQQETAIDGPTVAYQLDEPAAAVSAADSSGNQAPALVSFGTGAAVAFGGGTGPTTDGLTAATFAGGQCLTATLAAAPGALEFWFATTNVDAVNKRTPMIASITAAAPVIANGHLTFNGAGDAGFIADGLVHHVVWQGTSVYLDGALTSLVAAAPSGTDLFVGGDGDSATTSSYIGSLAHARAYSAPLSGARITAHYQAGSTGFAGESGTARITRLAGYGNLPIGTLDTSLTNVAFVDITTVAAVQAIADVADAEFGLAFFDGSGNLTFHNRLHTVSKLTPDVTIDANFLAEGTQFVVDMQGVLNYFETTASGTKVKQVVRDTVSENGDGTAAHPKHGRYPGSKSYLVQTDQEALDRGNWIVSTHSQPAPRVGSLVVDVLTMTAAQQQAMAGLEPNSWLRVTGLPGQTPGSTTADFIVQGWAEAVNSGEWTLAINAANKAVAAPTPWILDNATYSVLDSTTRVFV